MKTDTGYRIPGHRGTVLRALVLSVPLCLGATVSGFSQCPDGAPPPCAGARTVTPNSVAVLYFDTRDSSDRYLTDGLTEEIILRLQQLPRLAVKSRHESQRVRQESARAPAALGRSLGVRYLVSGTVQRAGDRVVVRVELTRADQAVGIWSERYDQTSGNVLDVIEAIARGVATGVAGRLLPAEATDLARRPTADPVAYEQFLRGNFFLAQRTPASLARAVAAYDASTMRDPTFKPPLARFAYAWALGLVLGVDGQPRDSIVARANRATAQAVNGAPDLSDTWLARGFLLAITTMFGMRDDLAGARSALARAVELDPRSAEAHHQFGQVLLWVAEDSLADAEYQRAIDLEPGRAVSLQERSVVSLYRGRYAEAVRWADSAIAIDPRFSRTWADRAMARLALGDASGALDDATRAVSLSRSGTTGESRAVHAAALAATGDTASARREAEDVVAMGGGAAGASLAPVPFAVLGDHPRALEILEHLASRALRCAASGWPALAPLRADPRFVQVTATCPRRR